MKYTAEEVRDYADACRLAHNGPVIADMLTELAERIKVDESAAPVGFVMEATATRHKFGLLTQDLPPGAELFTHPPAQAAQVDPAAKPRTLADFVNAPNAERVQVGQQVAARVDEMMAEPVAQMAQVDQVGELLAIIHGDGGHYQAEHGLQKAAKDAQEKVIQMMTKIATAEPVAQPADSGRVTDGWVLVPREPTKAMLDAAMAREDDEPLTDWGKIIPAPHAEIYKAMLAAVPSAPEGESHE